MKVLESKYSQSWSRVPLGRGAGIYRVEVKYMAFRASRRHARSPINAKLVLTIGWPDAPAAHPNSLLCGQEEQARCKLNGFFEYLPVAHDRIQRHPHMMLGGSHENNARTGHHAFENWQLVSALNSRQEPPNPTSNHHYKRKQQQRSRDRRNGIAVPKQPAGLIHGSVF
ncbi:hypothetical protein [Rhizobium mongolense]|uniref:hypothetical protein n=1 Tax=Rhizobium mongolense TaxID=57676 RepID=UPI001113CA17|nr:hypothetical protein [Rhizobium mongolense]